MAVFFVLVLFFCRPAFCAAETCVMFEFARTSQHHHHRALDAPERRLSAYMRIKVECIRHVRRATRHRRAPIERWRARRVANVFEFRLFSSVCFAALSCRYFRFRWRSFLIVFSYRSPRVDTLRSSPIKPSNKCRVKIVSP